MVDRSNRDDRSWSAVEAASSGESSGSTTTCRSNGLDGLQSEDAVSRDRGHRGAIHEDTETNERLRLKEYGVKVCRVSGRGRGLFAESRSYKPGGSHF